MTWITPKTDWNSDTSVTSTDLNRWEGNLAHLKSASSIDLADAGGYFTTKNVEAALQQCKNALGTAAVLWVNNFDTVNFSYYGTTINSNTGGVLNVTNTTADPIFALESVTSLDPHIARYVELRYRIISGGANCSIFFTNDQYTFAHGNNIITVPLINDGQWHTAVFDGWSNPNWKAHGYIRGFRLDWVDAFSGTVNAELDYVRIRSFGIL